MGSENASISSRKLERIVVTGRQGARKKKKGKKGNRRHKGRSLIIRGRGEGECKRRTTLVSKKRKMMDASTEGGGKTGKEQEEDDLSENACSICFFPRPDAACVDLVCKYIFHR